MSGENPGAAAVAIVIDAIVVASAWPSNRSRAMARDSTATAHAPEAWIDRPIKRPNRSPANAHHIVPNTKIQSAVRTGMCRPSRSDNGPTINCPTAKIARKTVMVDVTAALDTRRSAAIVGNEGRKMFVDRIPVAANAQITALQAAALRGLAFVAGALLRTTSMLMAAVSRACLLKRREHRMRHRLRCHGSPAGRLPS
jgi:hypothetical protein